jgi:hypothetical protein
VAVETERSAGASPTGLPTSDGLLTHVESRRIAASCERVFQVVGSLGGERGWPAYWLWRLRGALDRLVGGVGLRRGRPRELRPGEALDFWRVDAFEPPRLIRLRAEIRLPGRGWLQFVVVPEEGGSRLVQTALFEPRGVGGYLYWYGLWLVHLVVYRRLVRCIASEAEGGGAFAGS